MGPKKRPVTWLIFLALGLAVVIALVVWRVERRSGFSWTDAWLPNLVADWSGLLLAVFGVEYLIEQHRQRVRDEPLVQLAVQDLREILMLVPRFLLEKGSIVEEVSGELFTIGVIEGGLYNHRDLEGAVWRSEDVQAFFGSWRDVALPEEEGARILRLAGFRTGLEGPPDRALRETSARLEQFLTTYGDVLPPRHRGRLVVVWRTAAAAAAESHRLDRYEQSRRNPNPLPPSFVTSHVWKQFEVAYRQAEISFSEMNGTPLDILSHVVFREVRPGRWRALLPPATSDADSGTAGAEEPRRPLLLHRILRRDSGRQTSRVVVIEVEVGPTIDQYGPYAYIALHGDPVWLLGTTKTWLPISTLEVPFEGNPNPSILRIRVSGIHRIQRVILGFRYEDADEAFQLPRGAVRGGCHRDDCRRWDPVRIVLHDETFGEHLVFPPEGWASRTIEEGDVLDSGRYAVRLPDRSAAWHCSEEGARRVVRKYRELHGEDSVATIHIDQINNGVSPKPGVIMRQLDPRHFLTLGNPGSNRPPA